MSTYLAVETTDLDRMMGLLEEYTTKLRNACEQRVLDKQRTYVMAAIATLLLTTGVGVFVAFRFPKETDTSASLSLALGSATGVICTLLLSTINQTRRKYRSAFDEKTLFFTLEKLVRTASSYSEHASQRIGDKFLFDLRVAEAEGVLLTYRELFPTYLKGNKTPITSRVSDH